MQLYNKKIRLYDLPFDVLNLIVENTDFIPLLFVSKKFNKLFKNKTSNKNEFLCELAQTGNLELFNGHIIFH